MGDPEAFELGDVLEQPVLLGAQSDQARPGTVERLPLHHPDTRSLMCSILEPTPDNEGPNDHTRTTSFAGVATDSVGHPGVMTATVPSPS